jgi:hypothetical protein
VGAVGLGGTRYGDATTKRGGCAERDAVEGLWRRVWSSRCGCVLPVVALRAVCGFDVDVSALAPWAGARVRRPLDAGGTSSGESGWRWTGSGEAIAFLLHASDHVDGWQDRVKPAMPWFTTSKPEVSALSREDRTHCWESRDVYFACLDSAGILEAGKEGNACAKEKSQYEAGCAKSWASRSPLLRATFFPTSPPFFAALDRVF